MIQVAVLNRSSWNSHSWCESTHGWILFFFLETIGPIEWLIWEKMYPKTGFLAFIRPILGVLGKKFQSRIWYPISHRKSYINCCRLTLHSQKNGHAPQKLFFAVILENIVFFLIVARHPFPSKLSCPPTNDFLQFFQHKLKNIRKVFLLGSILNRKKILWRLTLFL